MGVRKLKKFLLVNFFEILILRFRFEKPLFDKGGRFEQTPTAQRGSSDPKLKWVP